MSLLLAEELMLLCLDDETGVPRGTPPRPGARPEPLAALRHESQPKGGVNRPSIAVQPPSTSS